MSAFKAVIIHKKIVTVFDQPKGRWRVQIVEENMDIIGGIAIYLTDLNSGDPNPETPTYRQLIFQETPPAIV